MSLSATPWRRRAAVTWLIRWALSAMAWAAVAALVCTPRVMLAWSGAVFTSP